MVMRLIASVCVSVCPAQALTFECLDLQISLLVCRYIFGISRSSLDIKVIRSRSRSQEQQSVSVCPLQALGLTLTRFLNALTYFIFVRRCRTPRLKSDIRVIRSRSRSYGTFAGGLPLLERQSCSKYFYNLQKYITVFYVSKHMISVAAKSNRSQDALMSECVYIYYILLRMLISNDQYEIIHLRQIATMPPNDISVARVKRALCSSPVPAEI